MLGRTMKAAVAVAAVVALWVPMATAGAASQNLEFTNTGGSVTVGSLPPIAIAAGGAGLSGTWDDTTGAFSGSTQFNPISVPADPPAVPVDVVVSLGNNGTANVTGTIDPTTGAAALTASMTLTVEVPALEAVCTTDPFDVQFTDSAPLAPLPFDSEADYSLSLAGTFTVPVFGDDCSLAAAINAALGLPAGGTAALALERGTPAPPTTPTTSAEPSTTSTGVQQAATAPRFTG